MSGQRMLIDQEKEKGFMIKIIGVRFRSAGKAYYFDPKDLELRMGDHVIAETSKGLEYGVISTCMKMVDEELVQQPLRSLNRKATKEDEAWIEALRGKEREAMRVCREKVREHGLDMKMVDAEYSFDGSKVLFYFTADGRVDFRNLVKDRWEGSGSADGSCAALRSFGIFSRCPSRWRRSRISLSIRQRFPVPAED